MHRENGWLKEYKLEIKIVWEQQSPTHADTTFSVEIWGIKAPMKGKRKWKSYLKPTEINW